VGHKPTLRVALDVIGSNFQYCLLVVTKHWITHHVRASPLVVAKKAVR
jgi:hypothetical protein